MLRPTLQPFLEGWMPLTRLQAMNLHVKTAHMYTELVCETFYDRALICILSGLQTRSIPPLTLYQALESI